MISIRNLSKKYGDLHVLKDISLEIQDGEIYGLVGRSGAGKSTLLRCINGLENFQSGSLKVGNTEIKELSRKELRVFRKDIGMIFQHFSILERKTVYDNIAYPLKCWKIPKEKRDTRIKELVKLVDLEEKLYVKAKNLSGGQKQRVAIARALALSPSILLCDEATSALDPRTTKDILALLRKINEELKITIVVVTHQMSVVRQICTKLALLENGTIMEDGDVGEVFMRQPGALKRLIGEEGQDFPEGCNYEMLTEEGSESEKILSSIARDLQLQFSIVDGEIEHFRTKTFGKFVIHFDDEYEKAVTDYLDEKKIKYKKVTETACEMEAIS